MTPDGSSFKCVGHIIRCRSDAKVSGAELESNGRGASTPGLYPAQIGRVSRYAGQHHLLRARRVALADCFGYARPECGHAVAAIQEIV
jgi:hypothetical protein